MLKSFKAPAFQQRQHEQDPYLYRYFFRSSVPPLQTIAQEGKIRLDLYYRVAGMTLAIPLLRKRPQDIVKLAGHFINKHQKKEYRILSEALSKHEGDLTATAGELGISRVTLWRRRKKYNL